MGRRANTAAIVGIALILAAAVEARAGTTSCVIGTDPVAANDVAQIATLRTQIAMHCDCADYDGSTRAKSHGRFVRCARDLIGEATGAGDLRSRCRGTVKTLYRSSTCGFAPAEDPAAAKHPCIEQRLASGRVRCRIKPQGRCISVAGVVSRVSCTATQYCVDAADDNGNYLFVNDPTGDDDGICADAEPIVRFVAVGDTGKGNAGQFAVAAGIRAKCAASGCDFVQLLGDNIYENGVTSVTDPQWQAKFELPYEDIELPFYVVLGNHDYGGNGVGNEFGKGQHEIDYSAVSAKWKLPAAYYSRTWRNVEIFGLDSNAQIFSMDAQQRIDIAAWLAASTATWRIVVGHHPYLSNGPHGNAGSYVGASGSGAGVKSFMEGVVCGNSDVHLSGHDHSMQWLTPTCAGTELIVSGAGAAPTTLPGSTPAYFQSTSLGFAYIVVDGNTFTVEFVDASGATLFTRSITKP